MDDQVACADVHRAVRIGTRHACIIFTEGGGLALKYKHSDRVLIDRSDIIYTVKGASMAALVLGTPMQIATPPAKPVTSVVITNGCDSHNLWNDVLSRLDALPNTVDARSAPFLVTACGRHSVQILGNDTVVLWHANTRCTVATNIHMVFMQRTKGGMATYDVHLLRDSCMQPVTVEMLPHSSLGIWRQVLGSYKVYDFGPDPVKATLLSDMYREYGCSWEAVMSEIKGHDSAAHADSIDSESDSDSVWSPRSTSSDDAMSEASSGSESSGTSNDSAEY